MKRSTLFSLSLATLLTAAISPTHAQEAAAPAPAATAETANLPGAREVFQKHLDALGGAEAIAAVKNLVMSGSINMPAMGLKGKVEIVQVKPSKISTVMELPQVGEQIQVFDGEMGWMGSAVMGMQKMSEEQIAQTKAQLAAETMEGFRATFKKARVIAKSKFDDADAYEMALVTKNDDKMSMFFDTDSGLIRGMKMVAATPMGEVPMTIFTRDYQPAGGVKMARSTIIKAGPSEIVMTMDDIKVNGEVPPGTFDRPADL